MSKRIIFHHPRPLNENTDSGSTVRPKQMLAAFRAIGLDPFVVSGDSKTREIQWKQALNGPHKIIGVYSELLTTPIYFSDDDHFPRNFGVDFYYMRKLKKDGFPVGVFYRDLHWRYTQIHNTTLHKYLINKLFHWVELFQLRSSITHLFTPTTFFHHQVPVLGKKLPPFPLPPATKTQNHLVSHRKPKRHKKTITLIYVGGIQPPNKDLTPTFSILSQRPDISLILCCKKEELEATSRYYRIPPNVKIYHRSEDELSDLYQISDCSLIYKKEFPYHDLALPVKIFESLSFCTPIITNTGTAAGNFIADNNFGWSIKNDEELNSLLDFLKSQDQELISTSEHIRKNRNSHSWEQRAAVVRDAFLSYENSHKEDLPK